MSPPEPNRNLQAGDGAGRGPAGQGPDRLLTSEHEALCQSGAIVSVAAGLPGEVPAACVGLGCRILADGTVRLFLQSDSGGEVLDYVARGAALAATFSDSPSHRSIQLKSSRVRVVPATEEDVVEAQRQMYDMARQIVLLGFPTAYTDVLCHVDPRALVVLEFRPEAAFTQTPGPGAGATLT